MYALMLYSLRKRPVCAAVICPVVCHLPKNLYRFGAGLILRHHVTLTYIGCLDSAAGTPASQCPTAVHRDPSLGYRCNSLGYHSYYHNYCGNPK